MKNKHIYAYILYILIISVSVNALNVDQLKIHSDARDDGITRYTEQLHGQQNDYINNRYRTGNIISGLGDDLIWEYINTNEQDWDDSQTSMTVSGASADNSGLDSRGLGWYLLRDPDIFHTYQSYLDFELDMFCTKLELELVHQRIDKIEAVLGLVPNTQQSNDQVLFNELLIRATRTGQNQYYNEWVCMPDRTECLMAIGK